MVRGAEEIRVEISARGVVTPKVSTADSPARLVVALPGTVMATGQSHITVGSAGVKDVRIGMDGQTPPTTRVVVDLEHACRYDLNPSADGKLVLTLYNEPATAALGASGSKACDGPPLKRLPAENPTSGRTRQWFRRWLRRRLFRLQLLRPRLRRAISSL